MITFEVSGGNLWCDVSVGDLNYEYQVGLNIENDGCSCFKKCVDEVNLKRVVEFCKSGGGVLKVGGLEIELSDESLNISYNFNISSSNFAADLVSGDKEKLIKVIIDYVTTITK